MDKSLSILLGAGFSAPMGYPIGDDLNQLLLKSNHANIGFNTDGSLFEFTAGSKSNDLYRYKSNYEIEFEFCFELMNYFNQTKGHFDYEEFYDYILDEVKEDIGVAKIAEPFLRGTTDLPTLIHGLKAIYTQVVSFYLKDRDGNKYYDNLPYDMGPYYSGYSGVMKCISDFSENFIVNIHTLNHDLFFERFKNTEFLKGELSDGFEELGSPYYGRIFLNSREYMVRLSRYIGIYESKFSLYKLHGSLNYEPYYRTKNGYSTPEIYLKTGYGVRHTEHYKEKTNEEGKLEYENSWINYHSDFLTGTTSKIVRYTEPLLFKRLFELFKTNLINAEKLIIIGYGAKDQEINDIILNYFDFNNKKVFIIDPYAGDVVKEFGIKLNAKVIGKQLEDIEINDLD